MCFILGAGNAAKANAAAGKNANSASVRNEFVRAMDQALGQKKNDEIFRKRLGQVAIPASSHPGYMKSQQEQRQQQSTLRDNRLLEDYQDYAIDLSEYALKYVGCSNIRTWSDDLAAANNGETNSVLKMDKFVVMRLCPRDSCSNYNQYGCLEDFGDYLIPMEIYLQTMAETYFTQYQEYCQTCYECMTGNNNNNNNNNNNYYNNNGGNNNNYYNNNGANNNNYYNNNGANNNNYYNNGDDANYYYNNGDDANNYYNNGDDGNYNNYNNGNGNGNGNNYNNGNYYNNGNRRLNDDAYNYYDNNNNNNYYAGDDGGGDDNYYNQNNDNGNQNQGADCEYYSVCGNYQSACQEYSNLGFDMEDYFECAEFNIGNSAGYLGPHCASDGKTISMGIFNDEYCNDYSADISEISSYMAVSENDLESYYSDKCISCLATVSLSIFIEVNTSGSYDFIHSNFEIKLSCLNHLICFCWTSGWVHIGGSK